MWSAVFGAKEQFRNGATTGKEEEDVAVCLEDDAAKARSDGGLGRAGPGLRKGRRIPESAQDVHERGTGPAISPDPGSEAAAASSTSTNDELVKQFAKLRK